MHVEGGGRVDALTRGDRQLVCFTRDWVGPETRNWIVRTFFGHIIRIIEQRVTAVDRLRFIPQRQVCTVVKRTRGNQNSDSA